MVMIGTTHRSELIFKSQDCHLHERFDMGLTANWLNNSQNLTALAGLSLYKIECSNPNDPAFKLTLTNGETTRHIDNLLSTTVCD